MTQRMYPYGPCARSVPCACGERPAPCPPPPCPCCERCAEPPAPPPGPPPSCYPQRPLPPGGFLLPRIIAAGREWQRRCNLRLTVDGLPMGLEPPLTLLSVTACGTCTWEELPAETPRTQRLRVTVPLQCRVRDRCDTVATGRAAITVDVCLRMHVPAAECWRGSFMAIPCVRLICAPCPADTPIFDVLLEVMVEAYITRWEPCLNGPPKPACPDLPLFPQPCFP